MRGCVGLGKYASQEDMYLVMSLQLSIHNLSVQLIVLRGTKYIMYKKAETII